MWIFTPGGLLMPAAIPTKALDGVEADPKLTLNGQRGLQVRARDRSHLTNFIRDYMDPMGLDYSDIEATPQMDYNFRFYTTHEEFAVAVQQAVMDIDYLKFKPTAERKDEDGKPLYEKGKEYHAVLNAIWSNVCRLGRPGGVWGARSKTNPNGYSSAADYAKRYPSTARSDVRYDLDDYPIETTGRSFYDRWADGDGTGSMALLDDYDDDMSWTPSRERRRDDTLRTLSGIPVAQWPDLLDDDDLELVAPYMDAARRDEKRQARAYRKTARKARYRRS